MTPDRETRPFDTRAPRRDLHRAPQRPLVDVTASGAAAVSSASNTLDPRTLPVRRPGAERHDGGTPAVPLRTPDLAAMTVAPPLGMDLDRYVFDDTVRSAMPPRRTQRLATATGPDAPLTTVSAGANAGADVAGAVRQLGVGVIALCGESWRQAKAETNAFTAWTVRFAARVDIPTKVAALHIPERSRHAAQAAAQLSGRAARATWAASRTAAHASADASRRAMAATARGIAALELGERFGRAAEWSVDMSARMARATRRQAATLSQQSARAAERLSGQLADGAKATAEHIAEGAKATAETIATGAKATAEQLAAETLKLTEVLGEREVPAAAPTGVDSEGDFALTAQSMTPRKLRSGKTTRPKSGLAQLLEREGMGEFPAAPTTGVDDLPLFAAAPSDADDSRAR